MCSYSVLKEHNKIDPVAQFRLTPLESTANNVWATVGMMALPATNIFISLGDYLPSYLGYQYCFSTNVSRSMDSFLRRGNE